MDVGRVYSAACACVVFKCIMQRERERSLQRERERTLLALALLYKAVRP